MVVVTHSSGVAFGRAGVKYLVRLIEPINCAGSFSSYDDVYGLNGSLVVEAFSFAVWVSGIVSDHI